MAQMRRGGMEHKAIAKELGVSMATIQGRCRKFGIVPDKEQLPDGMKRCTLCKEIKTVNEFTKNQYHPSGYRSWCNKCKKKKKNEWQRRCISEQRDTWRTGIQQRLHSRIASGIRRSLVRGKQGKKTRDIVDWTIDELKQHLEERFLPGMSWDNHGKNGWEIDHIIPVSKFNFETTDDIDFRRCWALENLQPLWGRDNWVKNARIEKDFQPCLALEILEKQPV